MPEVQKRVVLPDAYYVRQKDVIPIENLRQARVTVIGTGSVGGFLSFLLTKMGVGHLDIWDGDVVEGQNLTNQWFRLDDLGKPKVAAMSEILEQFCDGLVVPHQERFTNQGVRGIVISAVDDMDVRVAIWKHLKKCLNVSLYVDTRMGAEVGKVFCLRPGDRDGITQYERDDLYPQSESFHAPCTEQTTVYCAAGLAALAVGQVANALAGRPIANSRMMIDFRCGLLVPA